MIVAATNGPWVLLADSRDVRSKGFIVNIEEEYRRKPTWVNSILAQGYWTETQDDNEFTVEQINEWANYPLKKFGE